MEVKCPVPRSTGPRAGTWLAALAAAVIAPCSVLAQGTPSVTAPAASSAPAKPAHAAKKAPGATERGAMDLRAPPLSHIYPSKELQYILAMDSSEADSAEEVSVKGSKYLVPVPLGQLQAIPWAILHPTQAWRVFTPLERP
jgi:hypothetical protein